MIDKKRGGKTTVAHIFGIRLGIRLGNKLGNRLGIRLGILLGILISAMFVITSSQEVNAALECTNYSATFTNSIGHNCTVLESTIADSTIYYVNISNSTLSYSNLNNTDVKISNLSNTVVRNTVLENMSVFDATITDFILTSGRILHRGYFFYPIFNISKIYTELPFGVGELQNFPTLVKDGITMNLSYRSDGIGYSVKMDMTNLDSGSTTNLTLLDDGNSPDAVASDNIYTGSYSITSGNTQPDGKREITSYIKDNLGNTITALFNITLDNGLPNATIQINPIGQPGFENYDHEYTPIRMVILELNYSDTYGIDKCRYSNSNSTFLNWESCQSSKSWLLGTTNGEKNVFFQTRDNAGNIKTVNDTITLNATGAGLDTTEPARPRVLDSGRWTNNATTVQFSWYNASTLENTMLGLPIYYKYKLNDTLGNTEIDWNISIGTDTQLTLTGLSLTEGRTYKLHVIAMNSIGNESNTSSSDGITLDTTVPNSVNIETDLGSDWTNISNLFVNWSATDQNCPTCSGLVGYSFILTTQSSVNLGNISINRNNKTYTNLADGQFQFFIKAVDNASNWGTASSSTIKIDKTKPSTPQLYNTSLISSGTSVNFNWTTATDATSGIADYTLIVNQSNGTIVFNANVGNQTNYSVTITNNALYYANVRAVDLAGNAGLWSSQVSRTIDTTAPSISLKKPIGQSSSFSPFFAVTTSESSSCTYTEITGNEVAPFDATPRTYTFSYTNATYHESYINLNSSYSSFMFSITCIDSIGNWNTTNISFSASSQGPSTLTVIRDGDYSQNIITDFDIRASNSSTGIGELRRDNLLIEMDNIKITDFSLLDKGDGNYTVKLRIPSISGIVNLSMQWYDAKFSKNITVKPLFLSISYSDDSITSSNYKYVTYYKHANYTVGIGMINVTSITINASLLSLSSHNHFSESYIFLTNTKAQPHNLEKYLKDDSFRTLSNPSFGYTIERNRNILYAKLSYDNYNVTGRPSFHPGLYEFEVKNIGNAGGKTQIRIKLKDKSSQKGSVIQWG